MKSSIDVSIVIPVYNSAHDLACCLRSIREQKFPKHALEIILCDGGSTDETKEIGKKFGCKILDNPKRLAEFGVTLGIAKSLGKYVMILAADNELIGPRYIQDIIYPFSQDERIMMTYPMQVSTKNDTWISRYINTFTDPISHFVYGNAANTRTFRYAYNTIEENEQYSIYDFSSMDYPMIALAQGTTMRKLQGTRNNPGDDILPVVDTITEHHYLAYVPQAQVAHHTISSLKQYLRKQQWAFDNYLMGSEYGIRKRMIYFSPTRKLKKILWPMYAVLIFPPCIVSIIGYLTSGKREWLYHFPLTMTSLLALVFELVRVTILRRQKINRKL